MSATPEAANRRMVEQLIARGALWSRPLIEAFLATPRHRFLDRVWNYQGGWSEVGTGTLGRHELRLLYADRALTTRLSEPGPGLAPTPISSSSQPSLMAEILEDLRLSPGLRTLEIGAGTGYNAALLAHAVGRVVSLEVHRQVLAEAEEHLRAFPDRAVELIHGDGRLGCPEYAPFDRILVTAAALDLEPAWLEQLADAGCLIAPLDLTPGLAYLVRIHRRAGVFEGRLTRPAYFMPLRAEDEEGRDNTPSSSGSLPPPDPLPSVPAPWSDWSEGRASHTGPGLLPSLAFLGWLHGYEIGYQTLANGQTVYGVGDPAQDCACWMSLREWRISGTEGSDLGNHLWSVFLNAGGPWPTEFRLRASPLDTPMPEDASGDLVFVRRGPLCRQVWTLSANRDRHFV